MTRASNRAVGAAIPDAVKLLEQRITQLADSGFLTGHQALGPSIQRAAAARMAHDQATRSVPLTGERQDAFPLALAAGLPVTGAAALAGVARRTLYDHRDNDDDFALQWENALEVSIGCCRGADDRHEGTRQAGRKPSWLQELFDWTTAPGGSRNLRHIPC